MYSKIEMPKMHLDRSASELRKTSMKRKSRAWEYNAEKSKSARMKSAIPTQETGIVNHRKGDCEHFSFFSPFSSSSLFTAPLVDGIQLLFVFLQHEGTITCVGFTNTFVHIEKIGKLARRAIIGYTITALKNRTQQDPISLLWCSTTGNDAWSGSSSLIVSSFIPLKLISSTTEHFWV